MIGVCVCACVCVFVCGCVCVNPASAYLSVCLSVCLCASSHIFFALICVHLCCQAKLLEGLDQFASLPRIPTEPTSSSLPPISELSTRIAHSVS